MDVPILPQPQGNLGVWAANLVQVLQNWFQRQASSGVETGTILPFLGDVIPFGYFETDGSEVSIKANPGLWKAIGDKYNDGEEAAGNFRLPDTRGRTFIHDTENLSGGDTEFEILLENLPEVNLLVTDVGHVHGVDNVAGVSGTVGVQTGTSTYINQISTVSRTSTSATTGVGVKLQGGGQKIQFTPQYLGGKWMIKA